MYDYNYIYPASSGASILAIILAYWVFILLFYAIVAIPKWKIYEKAGQPGWAALIPFYMDYVLFEIAWGNGILFLLNFIPGAGLVIWIITQIKLAQVFGKDGGWACGLIFLNIIFLYIMAFSDDIVYVGDPGKTFANGTGYGQPGYQNPYSQSNGYQQQGYQAPKQQRNTYQQSSQNDQYYYQQTSPDGPKYCSGCGSRLENNEKYCPKCGKAQ